MVRAVGATADSAAESSSTPHSRSDGAQSTNERDEDEQCPEVSGSHDSHLSQFDLPSSAVSSSTDVSSAVSSELAAPLTRVGSTLGTPRYMSPEQHLGHPVTAKTDQFGFCVALYEALYGKSPFHGKNLQALRRNVCAGKVRTPPAGARVPARIRRAVLKGLAADADSRHRSMADLLNELRHDPRRRLGIALAAIVLAGLAAVTWTQRSAAAERCQLSPQVAQPLWNAEAKDAIERAFAATARSHAADTSARVGTILETRATAWIAMQNSACQATWIQGTQSAALLDLRTECLSQRRAEQLSLIDLFSHSDIDAKTVDRAVEAASSLPDISACADIKALRSTHRAPPPGAEAKIAALRDKIAQVRVHTLAGDSRTAANDGEALVAAVGAIDYPRLLAEASYEYGLALALAGRFAAAQAALETAMQAAAASGDDRTAALAAAKSLWIVGYGSDRTSEALLSIALARALVAKVPDDVAVAIELHNSIGILYAGPSGNYAAAQVEFRQALELATRAWGDNDLRAAKLHNNIGGAALLQGNNGEGIAELTKARDLRRRSLGPNHPIVGKTTSNLGIANAREGQHQQAVELCQDGMRTLEKAHGPDHLEVARALVCMAQSQLALDQLSAAAESAERSLRIREQQLSPTHAMIGESATVLADGYLKQGKKEQALDLHRRAVAAFRPSHPDLIDALLGLGRSLTALGRQREAIEATEEAVAFATERKLPTLALAQAALARALWPTGNQARARALADKALAAFANAGQTQQHQELTTWLAARK